ncbi:MAG TPA: SRPBCC family protein [Halococcus sp.]|nr:SRPBCC family protein [Halococcus sp.]
MTTRAERTTEIAVSPEDVWAFLSDPEKRANAISVVESFELEDETHATWYLSLPIPGIDETVAIETEDTVRDPVTHLEFTGRSQVVRVVGEHELEPTEEGTRLRNRFTVDGEAPGIEQYFEKKLDEEFDNLETALRDDLAADS